MGKQRRFKPRKEFLKQKKSEERQKRIELNNEDITHLSQHVVTLGTEQLDHATIRLLSKGLSFCPTPQSPSPISTLTDWYLFERRIRLAHFFILHPPESNSSDSSIEMVTDSFNIPSKKCWIPPKDTDWTLEGYISTTRTDITDQPIHTTKPFLNLTTEERTALKTLQNRKDIVIKPADKGGAVVIWPLNQYVLEADRQLNNQQHYTILPADTTLEVTKTLNSQLTNWKDEPNIDNNVLTHLRSTNPKTANFYMLPKIHKTNNPGRPIISANECPTEKISGYVDHHLRPHVLKIPSYLKDTTHFLNKLAQITHIDENSILATIDVSALYTSIPHDEGLMAITEALDTRRDKSPPTLFIRELTEFILKNNVFQFNQKFYKQVQGTAMGTKMAPSYANLFMAKLEKDLLQNAPGPTPTTWWRYIDDIFIIWEHSATELQNFIAYLNAAHPTIKFTQETSSEKINFLDVTVYKDGNQLQTTLYKKPTDVHLYLHYKSCHPKKMKESIPYSQILRIRRICSQEEDFKTQSNIMLEHFKRRGYPSSILDEASSKALQIERSTLLISKTKTTDKIIPYVAEFNPSGPKINQAVQGNRRMLQHSSAGSELLEHRFLIAHKRPKNLRDILVRAKLPNNKPNKTTNCKCQTCQHWIKTTTITSTVTGESFPVDKSMSCKTENCIYLIQCKICQLQYVGESSRAISKRYTEHKSRINHYNEDDVTDLYTHFNQSPHTFNDVMIIGLQILASRSINIRRRTEAAWIKQLRSHAPSGLNEH